MTLARRTQVCKPQSFPTIGFDRGERVLVDKTYNQRLIVSRELLQRQAREPALRA